MNHYCDDCDQDNDHDETEWCCGGDGRCDAVEAEPDCVGGGAHRWKGVGGCDENPGVQSLGGTALGFEAKCTQCGVFRYEVSRGSQRNPGECDSVRYSDADARSE